MVKERKREGKSKRRRERALENRKGQRSERKGKKRRELLELKLKGGKREIMTTEGEKEVVRE